MTLRKQSNLTARDGDAGFTLIEMIVALAILSISFGVLLAAFSAHMNRVALNQSEDGARQLAVSLLASESDHETTRHGQTRDGYTWDISTQPYGSPADRLAWRFSAEQVTVTVSWSADHHVSLSTLRVAKP